MSSGRTIRALLVAPLVAGLLACDDPEQGTLGDGGLETPDAGPLPDGGGTNPDGGGAEPDAGFVTVGEVQLSETDVDFGAVVVGTTAERAVTITNPQANPVRVSLSDPSGPDADAFSIALDVPRDGASFELAPGAQATLTVTVDVSEVKSFLATLALDSCQGECPSSIVLVAEGVETGVVCPEVAATLLANPDTCVNATVTCENQGNATERVSDITLSMDTAPELTLPTVSVPVQMAPGDTLDVEVSFCPTELGPRQGSLLVVTDDPSAVTREVELSAQGGGPDVVCEPDTLDLGVTGVGDTITGLVRCTNRGDADAQVMGTLTGSAEMSLSASPSSPLAPSTTGDFEVSFSPGDLGAEQATLQITTNDPDTPTWTVTVSAEAVDLLPCQVEAHPSGFDFGVVALGDRRGFDLRLVNAGPTSCNVSGIVASAMPAAAFDIQVPAGITSLQPGAEVLMPVEFAPTVPGVASADVTASFSNPMSPDLVVTLTGEGGTPELQVEPFPLDFGPVAVSCAAPETRSVTIRRIASGFGAVSSVQLVGGSTAAFSLSAGPLPQNLGFLDTLQVDVTFTPPAVGAYSAELRVTGSGGTVSVPVTGEGQATSQRTDTKTLSRPPVDVLFVVDDSCSMGAAQNALGLAMPSFVSAFSTRGVDYHFGVVTTDMSDPAKSGRLQGAPTFVDPMTPNLLDTLSARMQPGTTGSGQEEGIRAAVAAVTPPLSGTANAGFLRANADLAVIWLSDENDFSQGGTTVQDYLAALRQVAGQDLVLAGITGPAGTDCSGPYGDGRAAPRYAEILSSHLNSLALSFCDDMQANLLAISGLVFGDDVVELSATPVIDTLAVTVNGVTVPRLDRGGVVNWAYDLSRDAVVFFDPTLVPSGATIEVTYDAFCLSATCGDSTIDAGEQCDDGNMGNNDTCINCTNAVCGDGFTLTGVEECDDGNLVETDQCTSACLAPACGDGFVQAGEECDDGNTVGGDGCPASCTYYQASGITSITFTELTNGTALSFADPDDGNAEVVLPFGFSFFGQPATSTITVSVNGLLGFGPLDPAQTATNDDIPAGSPPNGIVAAWWDDLELDTSIPGGADITWAVQGTAPNRVAIVQWRDVRKENHSSFQHRRFTFQVQLEEGTNIVRLAYGETETRNRVPTQTTATAGIEDATGALGYEALGCSPNCFGPPRPQVATGFPRQSMVTFTP